MSDWRPALPTCTPTGILLRAASPLGEATGVQKSKVLRNFLFSLVQLFTAAKEKNHDLDYGFQYSDTNDNASEDINCSKYRQIRDESFHIVYFMGLGSQTPTRKGLAGVRSFLLVAQSCYLRILSTIDRKMSKFQIDIDFSKTDLASLETEEDFQREAKTLLPKVLVKLGESVGEKTWEELQLKLQGAGGKLKSSPSEKRRFIQETGRTYQRNASNRERQELEDYIVEQLRQHKQ